MPTVAPAAPLGPCMLTADQIDPDNLKLECRVNGETRQSSNTNDLVYNCSQIISYTSAHMTLRPATSSLPEPQRA